MINYKINEKLVDENVNDLCNSLIKDGVTNKVTLMPDTHLGVGAAIGSVFQLTGGKLDVNTVGSDIGCGMHTFEFETNEKINFEQINEFITNNIPSGFDPNKRRSLDAFQDVETLENVDMEKRKLELSREMWNLIKNNSSVYYFLKQLGTLGGGNHFIELGKVENSNKFILIVHSGSRGFGSYVNKKFAKKDNTKNINKIIKSIAKLDEKIQNTAIPNSAKEKFKEEKEQLKKELSKLSNKFIYGEELNEYKKFQDLAIKFSDLSKEIMISKIVSFIEQNYSIKNRQYKRCRHNYLDINSNIVRKGAINAEKEKDIIIPLNMVDGVIVGVGKGNKDWENSAPHGAGRTMSRGKFYRENNLEDTLDELKKHGVTSFTMDNSTLDESPFAYKNSNIILENLHETVEIHNIYKTIFNFKGIEHKRGK